MENNPQNIHTVCINSLPPVVTVQKVCLCYYQHYLEKNIWHQKIHSGFSRCFLSLFQAEEHFERLNLIVPGSLLPFKKEINLLFEKERSAFCKKSRFDKIFKLVKIKPVFENRSNVKKLIVKSKIKWTKAYELWVASSQTIARSVGSCKSIYNSGNKLQKMRHIQFFFCNKSSINYISYRESMYMHLD